MCCQASGPQSRRSWWEEGYHKRDIQDVGITPPAVFQHVSKKRGYNIEFREDIQMSIAKLADGLIEKKADNLAKRICGICRMLQDDENACRSGKGCRGFKIGFLNI